MATPPPQAYPLPLRMEETMTTPDFDNILPRYGVLKFPDQTNWRRPSLSRGTIQFPAGISQIQVTWAGNARIVLAVDSGSATLAGAWGSNPTAAKNGRFPILTVTAEAAGALAIQGVDISEADLNRHLGVVITPTASL